MAASDIPGPDPLVRRLFNIRDEEAFEALAVDIFRFQQQHNGLYRDFTRILGIDASEVRHIRDIPFLPIEFFRDHCIVSGGRPVEKEFTSSGTTASEPGRHYVTDLSIYRESFFTGFRLFYGDPGKFVILALLPGYLERPGSSLVYMMEGLIAAAAPGSGFYLHDTRGLKDVLAGFHESGRKILLFGASYALLDFAEEFGPKIPGAIVMETGGMKGRQKEIIREELHARICTGLGIDRVHSEYGMTELLSQSYSPGGGIFRSPPWMKVLARDAQDPLSLLPPGMTGGLNIIDLANIYSCAFIATQDLGKVREDGSFEVLGRFDHSDTRGCSLLVT